MLGLDNSTEPRVELESAKWRPLILRECTEDMAPYYAPCLARAIPTIEYGEEIVYPDFEAPLPGFFNEADARFWVDAVFGNGVQGQTGSNKRIMYDERQARLVWSGVRGQNLVYKNVRFNEHAVPPSWVGDSTHCLGHMTSFDHWVDGTSPEDASGPWVDEAAVYITPDNQRYQHWLDHTTKTLVQSEQLITNKTLIIAGDGLTSKQGIVQSMWGWLPYINTSQIQSGGGEVRARRLITSCRVPYVHPYLFLRLQELVLGPDSPRVPLSERKVVMWYSRTTTDYQRANQGRRVSNEEEVKAAITALLKERGLGERLEVHPPAQAPADPLEYIRYLNRNVAAMLGPHGGGLCNIKWLAAGTLVFELMPRNWPNTHFYEESVGHGLNYWLDIREPESGNHDMTADVGNIIAMLKSELGKEPRRGPLLRYHYDWPIALDDTVGQDASRAAYFSSLRGKCCFQQKGQPGYEGLYVLRKEGMA